MKEFEKYKTDCYKTRTTEDICPTMCGVCMAMQQRRIGRKAALEWVKREAISLDERGDISRNIINRELSGE